MKVLTSTPIKNLDGVELKLEDQSTLTLGQVIAEAVLSDTSINKAHAYTLSGKVYRADEVDLTVEDVVLIKKALEACTSYKTLVTGQAIILLEKTA